jgi:hypothetical protein
MKKSIIFLIIILIILVIIVGFLFYNFVYLRNITPNVNQAPAKPTITENYLCKIDQLNLSKFPFVYDGYVSDLVICSGYNDINECNNNIKFLPWNEAQYIQNDPENYWPVSRTCQNQYRGMNYLRTGDQAILDQIEQSERSKKSFTAIRENNPDGFC